MRRLAAIVLVASLAAACGGDGPLSHRAHSREASKLCRRERRDADATDLPSFDRPRAAARAIERAVDRQRGILADLRDLVPPKAEAGEIARWLALIDQMLDEADLVATQLRHGDHAAASETAARVSALDARSGELARRNDITACRFPDLRGLRSR